MKGAIQIYVSKTVAKYNERCYVLCTAYVNKTVATWNERCYVLCSIRKQNGRYMKWEVLCFVQHM